MKERERTSKEGGGGGERENDREREGKREILRARECGSEKKRKKGRRGIKKE